MGVLRDPSLGCGAEVQLWGLETWGVRELEHGGIGVFEGRRF